MSTDKRELEQPPHTTFNFRVEVNLPGSKRRVCAAAFAEVDGLEITMQPKTIREGGNNGEQIHLPGPVAYGQLTLKRGMTDNLDLWTWLEQTLHADGLGLRTDLDVVLFDSQGRTEAARFRLRRCVPVKLRAPGLVALDGGIAIEEMQVAYERLERVKGGG